MHEVLDNDDLHAVSQLSYRPADPPDLAPQDTNNDVPTENNDIFRSPQLSRLGRAEDQISLDPSYTPGVPDLEAPQSEATQIRKSARGHISSWKYLEHYMDK